MTIERKIIFIDKIQLFVKTATGRSLGIVTDTAETVETLKRKIAQKEGVPFDQQILEFEGIHNICHE